MYFRELPNPVNISLDVLMFHIFSSSGLHLSPIRQVCGGGPIRRRCATSKASRCCFPVASSKLQDSRVPDQASSSSGPEAQRHGYDGQECGDSVGAQPPPLQVPRGGRGCCPAGRPTSSAASP